jgi:hypothetical protein
MLWQTNVNHILYAPARRVEWSSQEVDLVVEPEGPLDQSFLEAMQPSSSRIVIGHGRRVGICELLENKYSYEEKKTAFWLRAAVRVTDFSPSIEVALGGTSADKLAELRARRLLLNENPYVETRDINAITRELFIAGQDTKLRIQLSAFPLLYAQFGSSPLRFLGIAWIDAVVRLKLSACVSEVLELDLALSETNLSVSFWGRRRQQYQNRPAFEMRFRGNCPLV